MSHRTFLITHVLFFGERPFPIFHSDKNSIWTEISIRFPFGGSLFYRGKEYVKFKKGAVARMSRYLSMAQLLVCAIISQHYLLAFAISGPCSG